MADVDEPAFGGEVDDEMGAMSDAMMAVATEKMRGFRERTALRRLERNGPLARLATRRAHAKYVESGGDPGDLQSFMEWLMANWESILKMIMSIISLFSV